MKEQIQTLNYCAHAIEDLESTLNVYTRTAPHSAIVLKRLIDMLERSVKFLLPSGCEIINPEDIRQAHFDMARLPFPCVAFEASYSEKTDVINQIGDFEQKPATKRIALCWEANSNVDVVPGLNNVLAGFPEGGVFIVPIFWGPDFARWTVALGGTFFPYENQFRFRADSETRPVSRIANTAFVEAGLAKSSGKQYVSEPFYLFPELFENACQQYGSPEKAFAQISVDSRDETMMLIQACSVINCENVVTEDIHASAPLNKKRVAKGKQPFFTYKVLQLSEDRRQSRKGLALGEHASPRMHLRRGHLRRLGSKVVWVRPALVNAEPQQGVVLKDYALNLKGHQSADMNSEAK